MAPPGQKPVIPENAIISPLSSDWLEYGRVEGIGYRVEGGRETELREQIADVGRRLHALGFVPAADGNISVRLCGGILLITPSGASKGRLAPADISKIAITGELISGRKPSSEYLLHLCVYRARPDAAAVVHAHPPVATGLASAGIALDKPLTSELVIALGIVPLAGYATPGTEEVAESIAGFVKDHNAIMLANHGVVTYGADLETAFQRMETVEQAAKITLVAEHLGGGRSIPPEKVKKLEEIRRRLGKLTSL
ncbi:MAG: class II aldolase/adducin family protein [Elusimicrobia bacterium]|nr:class II aldolase/adducin family protein [Elusimicrobiota bacterium]